MQSVSWGVWRGQRKEVMKYGEGPRGVCCPWAPNVLATPLCLYRRTLNTEVRVHNLFWAVNPKVSPSHESNALTSVQRCPTFFTFSQSRRRQSEYYNTRFRGFRVSRFLLFDMSTLHIPGSGGTFILYYRDYTYLVVCAWINHSPQNSKYHPMRRFHPLVLDRLKKETSLTSFSCVGFVMESLLSGALPNPLSCSRLPVSLKMGVTSYLTGL